MIRRRGDPLAPQKRRELVAGLLCATVDDARARTSVATATGRLLDEGEDVVLAIRDAFVAFGDVADLPRQSVVSPKWRQGSSKEGPATNLVEQVRSVEWMHDLEQELKIKGEFLDAVGEDGSA
jgi:hypothetical protein